MTAIVRKSTARPAPEAGEPAEFPYINRELSSLEFNHRVLAEASDDRNPLLERVKFLAIFASNMDEFFQIRVSGLMEQAEAHAAPTTPGEKPPAEQLAAIRARFRELLEVQRETFDGVCERLTDAGIDIVEYGAIPEHHVELRQRFIDEIYPVLTPLAVDPGHPFPNLRNRSLNLAVRLRRRRRGPSLGVVQVPSVLARLVPLAPEGDARRFAWLEDVIGLHVDQLFPGTQIETCHPFRVTRNFDLNLDEEDADDLLKMIEKEVRRRDRGNAVRLEIDERADDSLRLELMEALKLGEEDVYRIDGPLNLGDLMAIYAGVDAPATATGPRLKEEPFAPIVPAPIKDAPLMMPLIARGDLLLQHPYESFDPIVDFVEEAAEDPDVLAIKQTLYRTSGDSPIVRALTRAAENRKQVTAIVEIKARFDEENNIAWARALEESGVHVVYGLVGLKTHCKMSLVVRREGGGIARYLHISTGNYNPSTARVYTDLSYFTANPALAADATTLFNLLTGGSVADEAAWQRFAVSPGELKETLLARIDEVARAAVAGKPARIELKMNALSDGEMIRALYAASQAGATVELLVRGICCLKPGVPGVSERIRVRGIVDRFLEHSRIFRFVAGDEDRVYLSSADWMPRNFQRRVELMFPVDDPAIRRRVCDEILGGLGAADARAWELQPDGSYRRVPPDAGFRPQARFLELAQQERSRLPPTTAPAPPPNGGLRAVTTHRRFG